jgi:hypothetical protein
LRDSHEGFAKAVADLDRAAMRAEQGLADLRAATDEAADSSGRPHRQGPGPGRPTGRAPEPADGHAAARDQDVARPPSHASAESRAIEPRAEPRPIRAPEPELPPETQRRLRAEDFEKLLEREARIPRDAPPPSPARPSAPKETPRSRARIDDDLFEGPEDPPRPGSTFRGRR